MQTAAQQMATLSTGARHPQSSNDPAPDTAPRPRPIVDVVAVTGRIDAIRTSLVGLAELRREVERRPVPPATVAERVGQLVFDLAAEGLERLPIKRLVAAAPGQLHSDFVRRQLTEHFPVTPLHVAAVADPERLIARLCDAAALAAKEMQEPIGAAERTAELARIATEELALLREEVDLLWLLDDAGYPVPWRADLPCRLVMGLPT